VVRVHRGPVSEIDREPQREPTERHVDGPGLVRRPAHNDATQFCAGAIAAAEGQIADFDTRRVTLAEQRSQ